VVHKALEDIVQSVLEEADLLSLMREDLNGFDVFVNIYTDEVAPETYAIIMMAKRLDIRSWSRTCDPSISKPLDFIPRLFSALQEFFVFFGKILQPCFPYPP